MTYKIVKYLLLLFSLCPCLTAFPQGQSSSKSINEIKRQPDKYIFAENTATSADDAKSNALALLTDAIFNALDPDTPDRREVATEMAESATQVSAMRGNLCRIFLYVSKDRLNGDTGEQAKQDSMLEENETVIDVEDILSSSEKSEETVPEETALPVEETSDPIAEKMKSVSKASDIEGFVKNLKSEGAVSRFGRLKDLPAVGKSYIFIFNKNNEVVARLLKEDDKISDLLSGKPRQISEFKGCGCIWMK